MAKRSKTIVFTTVAVALCAALILLWRANAPSSRLSEDKFVEVYVQLSLAKETLAADAVKLQEERQRVLQQAGVSQAELDDFIARYNERPQDWSNVWKKIVERLSEESARQDSLKRGGRR